MSKRLDIKTQELLSHVTHHHSKPFLRLADTLLDLSEAKAITSVLYAHIQNDFIWKWPDPNTHLKHQTYEPDPADRLQDADEGDEEYKERLQRQIAWPQETAQMQAEWIYWTVREERESVDCGRSERARLYTCVATAGRATQRPSLLPYRINFAS